MRHPRHDAGRKVLWDPATGSLVREFEGWMGQDDHVAFSPHGRAIATGSEDRVTRLWDAATGILLATFEGHTGPVACVAISPDGARLLSGA